MFEGKSAVERQRMVYKAIWVELQARPPASCPRLGPTSDILTVPLRLLWCAAPCLCAEAVSRRVSQEAVHAVDAMTTKTPAESGL